MLTLALPQFVVGLLVVLFVVVSVMMMLIVLIQRPQGGGLSEAFGSSSGSNTSAFGAKTGDALTTATIVIFLLFLGFAIGLNYMVRPPKPTPLTPAQAQGTPTTTTTTGTPGATEPGITATTVDPDTGLPSAPVKLERIDGPPPGYTGDPSTFTVPPTASPTPSTPPTTPTTPPTTPPTAPPTTTPTEPPAQPTPPRRPNSLPSARTKAPVMFATPSREQEPSQ